MSLERIRDELLERFWTNVSQYIILGRMKPFENLWIVNRVSFLFIIFKFSG
jgi:hypothetical protein